MYITDFYYTPACKGSAASSLDASQPMMGDAAWVEPTSEGSAREDTDADSISRAP